MKEDQGTEHGTEAGRDDLQLMTLPEAGALLGVGPHTLCAFMAGGHLPFVAIGKRQKRISRKALHEFIERGGMKGGNQ